MLTLPSSPTDPVVYLNTPPEVVRAIPQLLGFHPSESLVVLGLAGPHHRLRLTIRIDLPAPGAEVTAAARVVARLAAEAVSACVVVLFAQIDAGRVRAAACEPPRGREFLPGSSAAFTVEAALLRAGIGVRELLRADAGRWWSYTCDRPCCPPAGLPIGSGPTTLLEVLRVASGRPVFADRAELMASASRAAGEPTAGLRAALREREEAVVREPPGPRAARDILELHALLTSDAARARPGSGPVASSPSGHDDRTVAQFAVALTHPDVRDTSFTWTGGPLAGAATALWAELVRRVPAPYGAAPATLFAVGAYRRGDGALADAYLRRALADDPECRMADLVLTSLEHGFRPADVESALGLTRARHGSRRSAPASGGSTDAR